MTGASLNGSVLYAFGNAYGTDVYAVHKYNPTTGSQTGSYMTSVDFPGLAPNVYDIAYSSEGIWVARDESDSPVLRYNTSGVVTGYIMGTTVPCAAGLTVDTDGFLWVSDPDNDKIYKVDTSTSVEGSSYIDIDPVSLSPVSNPFTSMGMVNASGYRDGALVEVFDLNGRLRHSGQVTSGSFGWDASNDPVGAYTVRVVDGGNSSTTRLIKI